MILTDNETKVDLLNNEAIAATIIVLLRTKPDQPVTIGVHGDWGAGKSSVLEMIEGKLEGQKGVLCLKFNGWRFQGFEDAKIALIEGIVTGLLEKRPTITKAASVVKDVFRRIDWLKVAKKAGGLAFTVATGIPSPDLIQSVVGFFETLVADPAKGITRESVEAAVGEAKNLIRSDAESTSVPEEIGAFRKAFDDLLKEAGIDQLIVLIDDLDRCLPETAIETLEAIRLFVFTSRTAFVVAADEAMVEYAVRRHFPDLPDTTGPRDYARNYLEKLIQVPFRIPPLGETETRIYVTLLLIGAELGEDDARYGKLISLARERLRRPWTNSVLDDAAVKGVLQDNDSGIQDALVISDQLGPILAGGTSGNPRQIKRFLNTLLLRQHMAEARGFGTDVRLPVLAKLMLAERFLPKLFDQIAVTAATHPEGLCAHLAFLEEPGDSKSEDGLPGVTSPEAEIRTESAREGQRVLEAEVPTKASESPILREWLSSQPIRNWARVRPPLADVDLRPYLFVAKDRKDYFGATSVLGHLASVVERLLGPKLAVQALEPELRQLAPPEAAQVFEALRSRIMAADSLETQPAGIDGLSVLVRAQPGLQANLFDFLEALPSDRCGAWAVAGWEGVLRDSEISSRFDGLVHTWSTSARNKFLRAAAGGALRVRQSRR